MASRPPLEWNNKPVELLDREELIECVYALHEMVWTSAETNEALIEQLIPHATAAGRA